jgi:hypothetical protein
MVMRYWIFLEEQVQGPYTADELAALGNFSPGLLVCEENRQEWIPVDNIPELAKRLSGNTRNDMPDSPRPATPAAKPPAAVPPAPQTTGQSPQGGSAGKKPAVFTAAPEGVQGELFGSEPGQEKLFDNGEGSFYYGPPAAKETGGPRVTMPFRFGVINPDIPSEPRAGFPSSPTDERTVVPPGSITDPSSRPVSLPSEEPEHEWNWPVLVGGSILTIVMLGGFFYVFSDHFSSKSAIAEAVNQTGRARSEPNVLPGLKKPVSVSQLSAPLESQAAPGTLIPNNALSSRDRQAIAVVSQYKLPAVHRTIEQQSRLLLEALHSNELIHAAYTGQRLHLPDKSRWTAQAQPQGIYRVELQLLAWQAQGERFPVKTYVFNVAGKNVSPGSPETDRDFFKSILHRANRRMAHDIQKLLTAADSVRRLQTKAVVVKNGQPGVQEKSAQNESRKAQIQLKRMSAQFRRRYGSKLLGNVAKAYGFEP